MKAIGHGHGHGRIYTDKEKGSFEGKENWKQFESRMDEQVKKRAKTGRTM